MIISTAYEKNLNDFKDLMRKTDSLLNEDAKIREEYYIKRNGKPLEEDVRDALEQAAEGTDFQGTIELVSGAHFPDIVANKLFGVEVKSTIKNHWSSTGSSILESTRNQNVERIYMTFGKLCRPVAFLSKPYEECLSEIVVTHYPRYRIDMKLKEEGKTTIFDKMGIEYDAIRKMDNPVPVVAQYYKNHLHEGESLWWAPDEEDNPTPMTARLWASLSPREKVALSVEGCVLFPELFQKTSNTKYSRYALWLATRKGVINTNVRDSFSAGGQKEMLTSEGLIVKMPAVFKRVQDNRNVIYKTLYSEDEKTLVEYWGADVKPDRIHQWIQLVAVNASNSNEELNRIIGVLERVFEPCDNLRYTIPKDSSSMAADNEWISYSGTI